MIINLERGFSTYTDNNNSTVNFYGKEWIYVYSGVKIGYLYTPLTEAKGGVIPSLDNVLVNTGKLHLYVGQDLPASTTITVKRITEEWDYNAIHADDRPSTTTADQGTLVTSATAGTIVEIDIKDMLQTVVDNKEADGYVWFGVEILVDKTADCVFASWRNEGLAARPFIELKYSVPPRQPQDLRPMEGGVSTLTPVVGAMFHDDDSEDYVSKLQVQVNDTTDFSGSVDYDSGTITTTSPQFTLPGGAGLSWETLAYWRIRLGDSYGVWSPWSDIASLTPLDLPTVTVEDLPADTRLNSNYDFGGGIGSPWEVAVTDVNILADENMASCEDDVADYTLLGSTITRDGTYAEHGSYSLKCVTNNAAASEGFRLTNAIDVSASLDYTASVYIRGTGTVYLEVREYNSGDGLIGTTQEAITVDSNQAERYDVTRTFSGTGVKVRLAVITQSQQSSTFYVDKLMIEQASAATGWHVPSETIELFSLDDLEALDDKVCGIVIYNGSGALGDQTLQDDTSFTGVTSGDILAIRGRTRCSKASATLRYRVLKSSSPWTEYYSETEVSSAVPGEWTEHAGVIVMPETNDVQLMLDVGGIDDFEHEVEVDYLSLHRCIASMAPNFHHHYTAGDNGAQIQTKHDLHIWNDAEIWERLGLTEWIADATLYSQTPNGTIKEFGVYKINIRCKDGDAPRETVENGPDYAEVERQFEIVGDPDLPTVDDPDDVLETLRYEEMYLDFIYTGSSWTYEWEEYASAARYEYTNETDASVSFTFQGSEVKWISSKQDDSGIAEVFIDGVSQGTIDCYNPTPLWQQELFTKDSLSEAEDVWHTIKIVCTGTKHASSSDYYIDSDAFEVTGLNIPWPTTDVEEAELEDIIADDVYDYYRDGE
jgi:hypothetical protein